MNQIQDKTQQEEEEKEEDINVTPPEEIEGGEDGKQNTDLLKQLRATLREQSKELKQFRDEKAQKKQQEQLEKGQYDTIIAEKDSKINELTTQLRDVSASRAIDTELSKSNVKSQWRDLMLKEIQASAQYSEDGDIENLDNIIEQIKSKYTDAFKSSDKNLPDISVTAGASTQGKIPASQWRLIKDSKEKAKLMDEGRVDFNL